MVSRVIFEAFFRIELFMLWDNLFSSYGLQTFSSVSEGQQGMSASSEIMPFIRGPLVLVLMFRVRDEFWSDVR